MDHERDQDSSMDELMGPISNSMINNNTVPPMGPHNGKLQLLLPKAATLSYGALNENDHNLFEGMLSNDGINTTTTTTNTSNPVLASTSSSSLKPDLPNLGGMKRSFIPGLYWPIDVVDDEAAAGKRLQLDDSCTAEGSHSNSIASLLSQLPAQTPSLHQQTMLGALGGDHGLFRGSYQLPGMNWYS